MSRGVPIQTEQWLKAQATVVTALVRYPHFDMDRKVEQVAVRLTGVWKAGRAYEEGIALRIGLIAGGIIGAVLYAVFRELMS